MRVDEAGQNEFACGVDDPVVWGLRLRRALDFPDKGDPVSLDDKEAVRDRPPDPSINVPFLISSRVASAMTTAPYTRPLTSE